MPIKVPSQNLLLQVDCTKCDTPIAAPANNKPGPSFLMIQSFSFIFSANTFLALSRVTFTVLIGKVVFWAISL